MNPEFGPLPTPLPEAISRSSPRTAVAVGYHSVGMNPSAGCGMSRLSDDVSKTASASDPELTTGGACRWQLSPALRGSCRLNPVQARGWRGAR